ADNLDREPGRQPGSKRWLLLPRAGVETENGGSLRRVIDCALIGSQVDPVTAFYFRGNGIRGREISVGIEFQQSMAAAGLADVGISGIIENDRFRLAVVARTEGPDQRAISVELADRVGTEIGDVQGID